MGPASTRGSEERTNPEWTPGAFRRRSPSRDGGFAVLVANLRFTMVMVAGSVTGAVLRGLLLGVFLDAVLIPVLPLILLVSA